MKLTYIDWTVVALYFLFNLAIGFYYKTRAGKNIGEFFLSGRNVPWWLAGTSMVATTFAADTPLAVTGMVARNGIAGNWLWWNFVASGMLTVFFFARLWRRAGVMTDVEFAEIRYSGAPAAFLRGFRALYLGIPINCIILGWVNLAMVKILRLTLGVTKTQALWIVLGMIAITSFISTLAGLWGVLVTDLFQFGLKMTMVIVLAFAAVRAVGGIDQLKFKLLSINRAGSPLSFIPDLRSAWMPMITFLVYVTLNWWAVWYPGAEPGGGGYVAQRMFCAKDEKNSLLATLWFNIAHYGLRSWPWILVGMASVVLYPSLQDKESGYVVVMVNYLPAALRGLMLAGFAAAFMSTIGTNLNWGASYLVNDFYRRFLHKSATDRHYVTVSQIATVLLTIASIIVTYYMDTITGAWSLLMAVSAGTGGVLIMRWYWWRINAWSEISAMSASLVVSLILQRAYHMSADKPLDYAHMILITVGVTTATWLAVTFLTAHEPMDKLIDFYRRVRPPGRLWKPVALKVTDVQVPQDMKSNFVDWISGCAMIYGIMFGIGKVVLKEYAVGLGFLTIGLAAGAIIYWNLSRRGWKSVVD